MQVHIEQKRPCVLCIDLKLLYRLDVSSINIVELIVDHAVEKLEVYLSVCFYLLQHPSDRFVGCSTCLDIPECLCPPVKSSLAYRGFFRDLTRTQHLDEEGVDGEVVGLLLYRYVCRNPVCIVVELLDVGFAVFGSLLHLENALTRFLLIWHLFSFIAICRFRRETSLCGLLHS